MSMFTTIWFYFCIPVMRWIVVIFIAHAFLNPLLTTWAGDMLAQFWQMLTDELRGLLPW